MQIVIWTLIIGYGLMLLFIFLYSCMQLSLVFNYRKYKRESAKLDTPKMEGEEWPIVTIQLPVFNEKYVVERLLESCVKIDYPKDRLEIQLLDDSTDETIDISKNKVTELKAQGFDIELVQREDRVGFKAGALAYGMKLAKGEFIAIFDADFIPDINFLKSTIPHFKDERIGLVQTKWEHLNKDYSMLTRLQAFGLDAHFSVEQAGRNANGHFINFNGTAGVWRREAIDNSGGWQSDTLTEDLDLSYRAQMRGWKFKFLENIGSPAELPVAMNALKTQQYRWTKGAAECAVKNLWSVFKTKDLGFSTKVHATFHLLNSLLFICIVGTAVLSLPMVWIKNNSTGYSEVFQIATVFILSTILLGIFYWSSFKNRGGSFGQFLMSFPMFLAVYMGLSLHNAVAVFEGYIGRKTPFVRTPKFNMIGKSEKWRANKYINRSIHPITVLEGLLATYFACGLVYEIGIGDWGLVPYHVMLVFGFGTIFCYSVAHSWQTQG